MSKRHHDYFLYAKDETDAPMNKWHLFRLRGKDILSSSAQLKLEWIIFYHTIGRGKVVPTARHFGINPKTLHKWLNRFDEKNLLSLEEQSRAPEKRRGWMVTHTEENNIKQLRRKYIKLGKKKLQVLYQTKFGIRISTWKIERVVRKHQLYADKEASKHILLRRHKNERKRRIHHLRKDTKITQFGELWHVDAIVLWWYGKRRIIFTAIDETTRIAFARVYKTNSAVFAADFLKRLVVLSNGSISLIHSDNGSEFSGSFKEACAKLEIPQIYSRAYTPKDNALLERFNRTIQEEWLELSVEGLDDISLANQALTDWLIHYNNVRPHQALDYKTPLQYTQDNFFKVLPMWSASTVP
jgi:putative transposase